MSPSAQPGTVPHCRVCDSAEVAELLAAQEMMFGFRDPFTYSRCARCGSLSQAPATFDMARYYPPDYYSFSAAPMATPTARLVAGLCNWLPDSALAAVHRLTGLRSLGLIRNTRTEVRAWTGREFHSATTILDVGCGSGAKPTLLRMAGFVAEGLDPYYSGPESDVVKVHRCQLAELDRQYDVLNFDHSLEHMAEPSRVMREAFARLEPGGVCVVSLPKLPSRAFEKYRANWYALDPPRHYFVPSVQGLSDLARRTGFTEVTVQSLHNAEPHLWSEAYRRGVSRNRGTLDGVLSAEEQSALRREADAAFRADESCAARFLFRKAA